MKYFSLLLLFISLALFAASADRTIKPYADGGNIIIPSNSKFITEKIEKADGTSPPGMVPLGGMVAIINTGDSDQWQPPASGIIKDGFMLADGAAIPSGPLAGANTPNMTNKMSRGVGTFVGATGGAGSDSYDASGLTFTGSSTSYSVAVPGHGHDISTNNSLSVAIANYNISNRESTNLKSPYVSNPLTVNTVDAYGMDTPPIDSGFTASNRLVFSGIGSAYQSELTVTTSIDHNHPDPCAGQSCIDSGRGITGNIGNRSNSNGDTNTTASGNNTPVGSISGTVDTLPSYNNVLWIVRVE